MMGEPIEAVKTGVQTLVSTLRQDPYALETAYLSVITFDSVARQLVPLTELAQFQTPELIANGTTSFGEALSLVTDKIDHEVVRSTSEVKGDWKPLVFIMTDGAPTDEWQAGVQRLKSARTGLVVACAAGHHADTTILQQLTETVFQLETADSATIKAFFKWVSGSIATSSQKVDLDKRDVSALNDLPPPPPEVNVVL
jgi:uncharacterized protein YegL